MLPRSSEEIEGCPFRIFIFPTVALVGKLVEKGWAILVYKNFPFRLAARGARGYGHRSPVKEAECISGRVHPPLPPYPLSLLTVISPKIGVTCHSSIAESCTSLLLKEWVDRGAGRGGSLKPVCLFIGFELGKINFLTKLNLFLQSNPQNRQTNTMETPCKEGGSTVEESVVFLLCPNDSFSFD